MYGRHPTMRTQARPTPIARCRRPPAESAPRAAPSRNTEPPSAGPPGRRSSRAIPIATAHRSPTSANPRSAWLPTGRADTRHTRPSRRPPRDRRPWNRGTARIAGEADAVPAQRLESRSLNRLDALVGGAGPDQPPRQPVRPAASYPADGSCVRPAARTILDISGGAIARLAGPSARAPMAVEPRFAVEETHPTMIPARRIVPVLFGLGLLSW